MRNDRFKFATFALWTVALAVIGYWRLFTQFMFYDDEGGFLWQLGAYCAEGGLYDRVPSLYGPFYFTFNHLLHALTGLNFTHDTGRMLTLGYWCGTALLCGLFVWKQTRSVWAGLAAESLTFVSLITMIREPMHPSGFLTMAVALSVVVGGAAIGRGRPAEFAGAAALLGTAMALTKINVGGLFLIATVTWLAINSRAASQTRAAALLAALACGAVPMLLMRAQWPSAWVTAYVLVFTCGALTLTAALYDARQAEHGLRSWSMGLAIGVALAVIVIVAASARGASWTGLWEGMVVVPQQFSQTNYLALSWLPGVRELALLQLVLAVAYYIRRRVTWVPLVVAALRIVAGVWFFARVPLLFSDATSLQDFCFHYGPSLAWLMAVPLTPAAITAPGRARLWLAWVFIWQTLQAYPVAGSQIGWGSFLWIPLFVAGWHEAVVCWAEHLGKTRVSPIVTGLTLAGAAAVALWPITRVGYERFMENEPLGLPGASRLRLANDLTSNLRIIHQNIRAHAGLLFTYPDMFSFNVWAGHRRPSLTQSSIEAREQALFDQLGSDPRAVVVINQLRIRLLFDQGLTTSETLHRSLVERYVPAFRVDSYEFWVHRGRSIAPLSVARLLPGAVAGHIRLELTTEALARPVAAVELTQLNPPRRMQQHLPLDVAHPWQLIPITESGSPLAAFTNGTGPMNVSRTSRITFEFVPAQGLPVLNSLEIRLLDPDGQPCGRLRFAEKPIPLPVITQPEATVER